MNAKPNTPATKKAATPRTRKPVAPVVSRKDKAIAVTRTITLVAFITFLALVGGTASFQHLRELSVLAGQSAEYWWSTANLTPLSIDVMLLVASIQLRRKGITPTAHLIARVCSLAGLVLSLGGNVLVAWLTLPLGAGALQVTYTLIISAVPVGALLGATEMLTHTHKDRPGMLARFLARRAEVRKARELRDYKIELATAQARHAAI